MTKNCAPSVLIALALLATPEQSFAQSTGDYRSAGTGNWGTLSTWERFNGTTWETPLLSVPTSSDGIITIRNGHTVSVIAAAAADQVVVEAGGTLAISVISLTIDDGSGVDLDVYGTVRNDPSIVLGTGSPQIIFRNGSVFEHRFTTTAGTIPTATWETGSTLAIIGYTTNATMPGGLDQSFYHFTWNCTSQSQDMGDVTDTISIRGDCYITSTGSGSLAATLDFDGTTQQFLNAAGNLLDTTNLIIDNPNDVVLDTDLSIFDLTFLNGNLYIGDFDLTIGGSVTGAAATRCIVTENGNTGLVIRTIAALGSFQFPVAPSGTSYNPITLALQSGDPTETFSVRIESGVSPSAANNQTLIQRTFDISEVTAGSNNVTMTVQWITSEEGSSFSRYDAAFYHYNGSSWQKMSEGTTDSAGSGGPYTLTSDSPLSDFSKWSAGNSGGLPVQLMAFTATAVQNNAVLEWKTATELDNSGWEVERRVVVQSADREPLTASGMQRAAGGWRSLGFVEGAGTSTSPRSYSYSDAIPQSTISHPQSRYAYRLKQIDRSGAFIYSGEVEVEVGNIPRRLSLEPNYPNPFNPSTSISFSLASDGPATVRVFDIVGREVATLFNGPAIAGKAYRLTFEGSHLPSGVYFAHLESTSGNVMRTMLLLK